MEKVYDSVIFTLNNLYNQQHRRGTDRRPTVSNYNKSSGHVM